MTKAAPKQHSVLSVMGWLVSFWFLFWSETVDHLIKIASPHNYAICSFFCLYLRILREFPWCFWVPLNGDFPSKDNIVPSLELRLFMTLEIGFHEFWWQISIINFDGNFWMVNFVDKYFTKTRIWKIKHAIRRAEYNW